MSDCVSCFIDSLRYCAEIAAKCGQFFPYPFRKRFPRDDLGHGKIQREFDWDFALSLGRFGIFSNKR